MKSSFFIFLFQCFLLSIFGFTNLLHADKKKQPESIQKPKGQSEIEDLQLKIGDEEQNEVKSLKTEVMIARSENRAIEQALKLIKKYKGQPIEPELQFRLAEMYVRRARTARFFEINRESETIIRLAPKVVAQAHSRRYIEKAVQTYEYIQRKFPRFDRLDLVLFNNGFARQQLGQEREAERLYWLLIQKFPKSYLVPDGYLAIGEINFDRANFTLALEHFDAIRKYPESKVYPYGLYKAAWSYYNLRKALEGLRKLEEVVSYGKYVAENKIESRLDLRKEALSDMTVFYEDVYEAKSAYDYFKKQSGDLDLGPTLLKLSKLYARHSRHQDQQVLLTKFMENQPQSPYAVEVMGDLAWNYDALKKKELAIEHLGKFFELCRPGSRWLKAQLKLQGQSRTDSLAAQNLSVREDPRIQCLSTFRDVSVKLAYRWLKIWEKHPQFGDYAEAAEKSFAFYLKDPEQSFEMNQARLAYAELLFKRQKYRQASQEYENVSLHKDVGNLKHDASYAAVLSFQKSVPDKWSDDDEKKFQSLSRNYLQAFPKGSYQADIEFKLALIAYEKERYQEAAPIFFRLGRDFATTEKGKRAQDLYSDILNIKKSYEELKNYSLSLMKTEKDSTRQDKLKKVYEQSYFLEVQTLEDHHRWDEAIAGYKNFAQANPRSDLADKSWWNAVQLYFKKMDFVNGSQAAEEYYGRFPHTKNSLDALLKAAQGYESLGMLPEAADVLLKLALAEPKNAMKWNSLAVDFYMLGNQDEKARKILLEWKKSSDSKLRQQAFERLVFLERHHNTGHFNEYLLGLVQAGVQPQASLAKVEIVENLFKSGNLTEAFNESKKILAMKQASPVALSRARFIQAQVLEDEFRRQSVKSRAEKMTTVLALKTEKLEKTQQAYLQAIRYGDPQTSVQASRRLAGSYLHFIDSLKHMELPLGLDAKDEPAFRQELSQLSIPLEEKAIDTLNEGLRAAQRLRVGGTLVTEMTQELQKLNVKAPPETEINLSDPGLILPVIKGGASS